MWTLARTTPFLALSLGTLRPWRIPRTGSWRLGRGWLDIRLPGPASAFSRGRFCLIPLVFERHFGSHSRCIPQQLAKRIDPLVLLVLSILRSLQRHPYPPRTGAPIELPFVGRQRSLPSSIQLLPSRRRRKQDIIKPNGMRTLRRTLCRAEAPTSHGTRCLHELKRRRRHEPLRTTRRRLRRRRQQIVIITSWTQQIRRRARAARRHGVRRIGFGFPGGSGAFSASSTITAPLSQPWSWPQPCVPSVPLYPISKTCAESVDVESVPSSSEQKHVFPMRQEGMSTRRLCQRVNIPPRRLGQPKRTRCAEPGISGTTARQSLQTACGCNSFSPIMPYWPWFCLLHPLGSANH